MSHRTSHSSSSSQLPKNDPASSHDGYLSTHTHTNHEKKTHRTLIRKQRDSIPKRTQHQLGRQVAHRLLHTTVFRRARHIGLYLSYGSEIPTNTLIKLSVRYRKQVYTPYVRKLDGQLTWRVLRSQTYHRHLRRHRLGFYQIHAGAAYFTQQLDLLIIPALAISTEGYRLGYGGGFYDRTLARLPQHPYRLAVSYDVHCQTHFTADTWDKRMHGVLTPNRYLRFIG